MAIGPHEGKELELMLAGEKKLAAFGDIYEEGKPISEEIIPERTFAPYVKSGQIKRFEQLTQSKKSGDCIFHICFTLPGEEWRAHAYLWLREAIHQQAIPYDDCCDVMFGRLLGYNEADIRHFVSR